jgi:Cdc6-like AAA superfamily ATPase
LGKSLAYDFSEEFSPLQTIAWKLGLLKPEVPTTLASVMEYLKRVARKYKDVNGVPPVVVLDNVNILAQKDPEALRMLQDKAKNCADQTVDIRVRFKRRFWSKRLGES